MPNYVQYIPNYVQYIVVNKGLGMSPGKLGAQVGHAAVKGFQMTLEQDEGTIVGAWDKSGHTKIVLEARDRDHLEDFRAYAKSRGYESWLVIDEGRTEVEPHSPTALGFPILDKQDEEVAFTFSALKTYREKPRERYYRKATRLERRQGRGEWFEVEAPLR